MASVATTTPTTGYTLPAPTIITMGLATVPMIYGTTDQVISSQPTAPSWGMDCSVRPWDADCGEPMETRAELASTTESLLSHEPTRDPWDTGP